MQGGLTGLGRQKLKDVMTAESAVEKADRERDLFLMQQEQAEDAADAQLMGTASGIGGMMGASKVAANASKTGEAISTLNQSLQGYGEVGQSLRGGLTFTPSGGELLSGAQATEAINSGVALAEAGAVGTQAAGTATAAAEGATVAASQSGTLASLSTIAAPVAIALGIGFLLSKIF